MQGTGQCFQDPGLRATDAGYGGGLMLEWCEDPNTRSSCGNEQDIGCGC